MVWKRYVLIDTDRPEIQFAHIPNECFVLDGETLSDIYFQVAEGE